MTRNASLLIALAAALGLVACGPEAFAEDLLHEVDAGQYGLTRAWDAQTRVDSSRGKLQNFFLDEGTLFVQTDQSVTQAIDAATGKVLWTAELGSRGNTSMAPGVSRRLVAAVNGTTLYVLNRCNGKLLWQTSLPGAPGAGPAVSYHLGYARVYVPLVNGKIASYHLKLVLPKATPADPAADAADKSAKTAALWEALQIDPNVGSPTYCSSPGRALVQPLVTRQDAAEEYVAWATDQGYMCIGRVDRNNPLTLAFRLQTDAPIVAQPAYLPADAGLGDSGLIFAASQDGFVHAIKERNGEHLWRFPTAGAIAEAPVIAGRFVFVTNQLGGMYCLKAVTNSPSGEEVWRAPEITQFVAAGKQRVYAADKLGQLHILDALTGSRLAVLPTEALPIKVANGESDRLYLSSKTGLILCLHEDDLAEPLARRRTLAEVDDANSLLPKVKGPQGSKTDAEKPASTVASTSVPSSGAAANRSSTKSTPKTSKKTSKAGGSRPMGSMGSGPPEGYFDESGTGKKPARGGKGGRSSGTRQGS